jgi:hypothetical protein
MNPYLTIPPKTPGKFRVGDVVRIKHGWGGVTGEIVEDNGNIGMGGRRYYTVRVHLDDEPVLPIPEVELEPVEK